MDTIFQVRVGNGVYEILDGEGNTLNACPQPQPETPEAFRTAVMDMVTHVVNVQSQFLG